LAIPFLRSRFRTCPKHFLQPLNAGTIGLELFCVVPSGFLRNGGNKTSQVPGWPSFTFALLSDPGGTVHVRPLQHVGTAPTLATAEAPAICAISGLYNTAFAIAKQPPVVLRFVGWIAPAPRKTRFWLPCQTLPGGIYYPQGHGNP